MTKEISNIEQIQSNVTVGMDDLVNVFIAKYETSLIDKRNSLQDQLKGLNKIIVGLGETAVKDAKELVESFKLGMINYKNGYIEISTTVNDEFKLNWEKQHVTFSITTHSNSFVKVNYQSDNSATITSAIPLSTDLMSAYNNTLTEKQNIMDQLTVINNELRDISRKERQVRGRIAERKFVASGLEDLLSDQELVKLIQL
jgi:uncharacterized protein YPO0396